MPLVSGAALRRRAASRSFGTRWHRVLSAISLAIFPVTLPAATLPLDPDPHTLPLDEVSPWSGGLSLRTWAGYNDNPQLSSVNPVGSGFVGGGGDLILLRLADDGRTASIFASLEYVGYLASEQEPEIVALASTEFTRTWNDQWSLGGSVDYLFFQQVFDASEIQGFPLVIPAVGHNVTFQPKASWFFNEHWELSLELEATRQWLADPLDSLWEFGPLVELTWDDPDLGEISFSAGFQKSWFDTRVARDSRGTALPESLRYRQLDFDVAWTKRWGSRQRWETLVRAGYRQNLDNGGGFFDYDRVHLGGMVRYLGPRLEIRAEARLRWYSYPVQRTAGIGSPTRSRSDLTIGTRAKWSLSEHIRAFIDYRFESSDENVIAADYRMNLISGGLELDM